MVRDEAMVLKRTGGFAPVNQGQRGVMDLSGGMPTKAWIEIRNVRGDLQERIAAHIEGGTVSAECPAFPPGRHGWIQVCVQHGDEPPWREEPRIESLPAEPCLLVFQMDAVEDRPRAARPVREAHPSGVFPT
jgi:hypothetical protein